MYAVVWTRPDLSERCSRFGQYANNPAPEHFSALRNVYAYLSSTTNLGLRYQAPAVPNLETHSFGLCGYFDSSYTDKLEDCRSTSGYVFKLCGGPISWRSRKQSVTMTSSTESEYIALSLASKEGVWIRRFLIDIQYDVAEVQTLVIYGDNVPAISLTVNTEHHFCTKHINVPFHFVHEQIQKGVISIQYISTMEMPADGLTKPLTGLKFLRFVSLLGLQSSPEEI